MKYQNKPKRTMSTDAKAKIYTALICVGLVIFVWLSYLTHGYLFAIVAALVTAVAAIWCIYWIVSEILYMFSQEEKR